MNLVTLTAKLVFPFLKGKRMITAPVIDSKAGDCGSKASLIHRYHAIFLFIYTGEKVSNEYPAHAYLLISLKYQRVPRIRPLNSAFSNIGGLLLHLGIERKEMII